MRWLWILIWMGCSGEPDPGTDPGGDEAGDDDGASDGASDDGGSDEGSGGDDGGSSDQDADGYDVEVDCDDRDADIWPGADEALSTVDANCDGWPGMGTATLETLRDFESVVEMDVALVDGRALRALVGVRTGGLSSMVRIDELGAGDVWTELARLTLGGEALSPGLHLLAGEDEELLLTVGYASSSQGQTLLMGAIDADTGDLLGAHGLYVPDGQGDAFGVVEAVVEDGRLWTCFSDPVDSWNVVSWSEVSELLGGAGGADFSWTRDVTSDACLVEPGADRLRLSDHTAGQTSVWSRSPGLSEVSREDLVVLDYDRTVLGGQAVVLAAPSEGELQVERGGEVLSWELGLVAKEVNVESSTGELRVLLGHDAGWSLAWGDPALQGAIPVPEGEGADEVAALSDGEGRSVVLVRRGLEITTWRTD